MCEPIGSFPTSEPDRRGERICKALLAVDDLLTEHVEGPRDLADHARRLRNLQIYVAELVRELGMR